jgi:hypothetical protein
MKMKTLLKRAIYWVVTEWGGLASRELDDISICRLIRSFWWGMLGIVLCTIFGTVAIATLFYLLLYNPLLFIIQHYLHDFGLPIDEGGLHVSIVIYAGGVISYTIRRIYLDIVTYIANRPRNHNPKSIKSTWLQSIKDKTCYFVDISDWDKNTIE